MVKIRIENINERVFVKKGTKVRQIVEEYFGANNSFVACHVDSALVSLDYEIFRNSTIHLVDISAAEGRKIYANTLIFIMQRAVCDLWGVGAKISVMHTIRSSYYIELHGQKLYAKDVRAIEERMREIVSSDIAITAQRVEFDEAMEIFRAQGDFSNIELHRFSRTFWFNISELGGLYGDFYTPLLRSTAQASRFALQQFGGGVVLLLPQKCAPEKLDAPVLKEKLQDVYAMNEKWLDILEIPTVGALNTKIVEGHGTEIIRIAEALQEKEFCALADNIFTRQQKNGTRVVFISGPSSSGKTTFAKRLSIQLSVLGLRPVSVSLDDYFVDRDDTPIDANGEHDFEALEAVNVPAFNRDLNALLRGEDIELPRYDFKRGVNVMSGNHLQLNEKSILLVEGIHALNPKLSESISDEHKYLVYVSALTTLSLDNSNLIHTSDNRLLRRMVRDNNFRGHTAQATLARWASVRRGEQQHIFPYQENADYMFNTALVFEFSILRHYAEPLLREVEPGTSEYYEAQRLLRFLQHFAELPICELPTTSLFREFLGGSSFNY